MQVSAALGKYKMNYEQFIEEMTLLKSKGENLLDNARSHEDPDFRVWRHEVTDALDTMRGQGYKVNCAIKNRLFLVAGGSIYESEESQVAFFKQQLTDTLNEISTIINRYKKYGVPQVNIALANNGEVQYPNKVTWNWLKSYIPINWWAKGVAILLSVFLFGVTVGQSDFYKNLFSQNTVEVNNGGEKTLPNK